MIQSENMFHFGNKTDFMSSNVAFSLVELLLLEMEI